MNHSTPFSLRIFVADGDPDGLRVVERSNWIGRALVFPRTLFPKIKNREEFNQTGVYLLLGPREDGDGELLYIGEGDPVRPRLENHYVKKDFWNRAVIFTAGPRQLNKAHVQYLEAQLVQQAQAAKRTPLDNGNDPAEPTLSEADRADMDVFLRHLLSMLPVLGIQAFELPVKLPTVFGKDSATAVFTCRGKGVLATGYEATQGFVVKTGSQAVGLDDEAASLATHIRPVFKLRRELLKNGVLSQKATSLQFAQDYTFNSPSLAAAVIFGRSSNGRVEWKDCTGKTLKQIQEAQATVSG